MSAKVSEFSGQTAVSRPPSPQGGSGARDPPLVGSPCPIISDCIKVEKGTQTEDSAGEMNLNSIFRSVATQTEEGEGGRDSCPPPPPGAEQGREQGGTGDGEGWTRVDRAGGKFKRPTPDECQDYPPPGFQGRVDPCPLSNNPYQHLDSGSETSQDSCDQSYTSYTSEEQELDCDSEKEEERLEGEKPAVAAGLMAFRRQQGRLGRMEPHVDSVVTLHAPTNLINPNLTTMHANIGVTNLSLTQPAVGGKEAGSKKGGKGGHRKKGKAKRVSASQAQSKPKDGGKEKKTSLIEKSNDFVHLLPLKSSNVLPYKCSGSADAAGGEDDHPTASAAPAPSRSGSRGAKGSRSFLMGATILGLMVMMAMDGVHTVPIGPVGNHTEILAYDCRAPSFLARYDRRTFCRTGTLQPGEASPDTDYPTTTNPTMWVALAQENWVSSRSGWVCSGVKSLTAHICGLWGYDKALPTLSTSELMEISTQNCAAVVTSGQFKTEQGKLLTGILAPGSSSISYNEIGYDGVDNGDATCQGVNTVVRGKMLNRLVEVVQLQIVVKKEEFAVQEQSGIISVKAKSKRLGCTMNQVNIGRYSGLQGCAGVGETYVWTKRKIPWCPLHFVRTAQGVRAGWQFISTQLMAAFEIKRMVAHPPACTGHWQKTDVDLLWVSQEAADGPELKRVGGGELDPFLALALLKRYLSITSFHPASPSTTARQLGCLEHMGRQRDMANFKVGRGHFGRVAGDTVLVFKCKELFVPLREADSCFRDIPVVHADLPYSDVETRVLKSVSPPAVCSTHFAPLVEGRVGWWRVNPLIAKADAPQRWMGEPGENEEHGSHDRPLGFYTQGETAEWQMLQAMPVYQLQLEEKIRRGSCLAELSCPMPEAQGAWDWTKLEKQVPGYAWVSTLQQVWTVSQSVSAVLGLLLTPVVMYLWWKVRLLSSAANPSSGTVTVAVNAPPPMAAAYPGPAFPMTMLKRGEDRDYPRIMSLTE